MGANSLRYATKSFAWGVTAKVVDAVVKFASIPLLLAYLGRANFGLITLAVAANAYMQLLNMGINTGAVKFFSQWIHTKEFGKLDQVARTTATVYVLVGIVNALVLLALAKFGLSLFKVTPEQIPTLQNLFFILSAFSIVNWISMVYNQLLIADERMAFTQQVLSLRTVITFLAIFVTIRFHLSIEWYFILFSSSSIISFVLFFYECKKNHLVTSLLPANYWNEFSVVFKYSLAIFLMGIFQFTATQSRPLVLGMFSNSGVAILSDYRIIEVFPIFIISIGGMITSILLPKTSKAVQAGNKQQIERMAYEGTKFTSILIACLCIPVILVSHTLLLAYVGVEYTHLTKWLIAWVAVIMLYLHNTPIASLVLATGKTKVLVYSSAISCIVSMVINALLCPTMGVGSAVIGYAVYIFIQMSFYYFYFNNKILGLHSWRIFKAFVIPTALGSLWATFVYLLHMDFTNKYLSSAMDLAVWGFGFAALLLLFKVVRIDELKKLIKG